RHSRDRRLPRRALPPFPARRSSDLSWQVERRVASGVSLVPERRELFGSMSVEDNLLLGGFRLYREGRHGWRETLDEVYELFPRLDRKSTRLNSSHVKISYAVFCLKK